MPTRRPPHLATMILLGLLGFASSGVAAEDVTDFFNPVAPGGADPWLWRHDGRYYATATSGRDIVLTRSRSLATLGAGERKVVWTPSKESPVAADLWAPELHRLGDAWYLYVAADDGHNVNHRMYVLENQAADPFDGRFVFKGKIADPANDRWAIDGTVFRAGDRLFFAWSGWEGTENVRQNLYLAPMSNPWTLAGPRVEISRPTLPWETQGAPPAVNEAPQALLRGGLIHLVYSASGSWTDSYCLGLLTARLDRDLLAPDSWTKHERPVFASARGVYGPGHCTFTQSPDGREDWIVYHAARHQGAGWKRQIRAQPFTWDEDGSPRFGAPSDRDRPIPLPGGEPPRLRYEAEAAELAGEARILRRPGASRGDAVRLTDAGGSSLTVLVEVKEAGAHVLAIRYLGASDRRAPATQSLTVNDGPARLVPFGDTGLTDWSIAFVTVGLNAGRNRIRLEQKSRVVEVDCIDVAPGDPQAVDAR